MMSLRESFAFVDDFTAIWREKSRFARFRTGAYLLALWSVSFLLFEKMYQIDFRSGLISQTFEEEISDWDDLDLFEIRLITMTFDSLSAIPIGTHMMFRNVLEFHKTFYHDFLFENATVIRDHEWIPYYITNKDLSPMKHDILKASQRSQKANKYVWLMERHVYTTLANIHVRKYPKGTVTLSPE